MNGYKMLMESYKKVLEEDRPGVDAECVREQIKALEPLVDRSNDEILGIYDTGAFNDVTLAYCRTAMRNCGVEEKVIGSVVEEMKWLFEKKKKKSILK